MNYQQVTTIGSLPPVASLTAGHVAVEYARSRQRTAERLLERTQAVIADRNRAAERTFRPAARLSVSMAGILSAPQFMGFLQRERGLADRGQRRFSVLVLRGRAGACGNMRGRGLLRKLARRACKGLRSTDLVGRLAADHVEILLTETALAGAQVVATWVEQVATELGLDLEQSIYVYPSLPPPHPDVEQHSGPHNGVHTNGTAPGQVTRRGVGSSITDVAPVAEGKGTMDGTAINGHHNGHLDGHEPRTTDETSMRRTDVVAHGRWPAQDGWSRLGVPTPWWKRSLDIVLSAFALLLLSPLFVMVAIAIRLDSPGPVIFRQMRAGRGARPFVFYKFRSMIADAEDRRAELAAQNERDGPVFKIRRDPRITRLGRVLRRGSIDELPQLWNVLKGDISLVGPRPPMFDEVYKYEPWQRRRLSVSGGITCSWQVSGRGELSFHDWMRLDMRYIARRSPWVDLRLLAQTVPAVISGRGAC